MACANADRVFTFDLGRLAFAGALVTGPQPDGMGFSAGPSASSASPESDER